MPPTSELNRLRLIAWSFFRIGLMGFGGPFVSIAMMEEEFVGRRKWLTPEKFTELYAICKLLPGPIGPQMAIAVARECGGASAGLASGLTFLFPALVLVVGIAAFYSSGHRLPRQDSFFKGLQIGALSAIAVSLYQLFRPVVKSPRAWLLAALNCSATLLLPAYEPLYILSTGFAGIIWNGAWKTNGHSDDDGNKSSRPFHAGFAAVSVAGVLPPISKLLPQLFWICFKSGAFVFGTGLAILPLLENDFVTTHHWITHAQFMDAIAVGQVTPGPFTISVAFVGYLLAGLKGALTAATGIFLPCFINVLILVPVVWRRFSRSAGAPYFINWALPAVVGCIFAASLKLGALTVHAPTDFLILALGLLSLITRKVPGWAVIVGSGILNSFLV